MAEVTAGRDSAGELGENIARLVKDKKVLENRVKHLEKTSMNWAAAQFQATRSTFNVSSTDNMQ